MKCVESARLGKTACVSGLVPVAVVAGLLIGGAGGATALADPGSRGSTARDHDSGAGSSASDHKNTPTGGRMGKSADKVAGALGKSVRNAAGTVGSGRKPGKHDSTGATEKTALGSSDNKTDNKADNKNTKRNTVPSTAVEQSSRPVRTAMNVVSPVPDPVRTNRQQAKPVADVVASSPDSTTKTAAVPAPKPVTSGSDVVTELQDALTSTSDPGFVSNTRNILGLFSITTAADPDDNQFIAFVVQSPLFTDVLTSGADPENNLGALGLPGNSGVGMAGQTVNTFESPLFDSTFAIPVTDPFAPLYTALVQAGF